jgi:hypothetical protein
MSSTTIRKTTGKSRSTNHRSSTLDQWICFQTLTGGLGALFYDSSDQVVWAYFKPADNDTPEEITRQLAELQKFGPGFTIWVPLDRTFEV